MYIGKTMHIMGNCIILKSKKIKPEYLGRSVYDKKKRKIGKIVDIFGNIKYPYVKILIKGEKDKEEFLNKEIYLR